ncbi:MAG: hypothetical protein EKK63_02330 [Acinetobacter sp.]|uniref:hypothetical protein n=1 Tax=Acinetobacter sp. TaxID=472 RepID=UPI000FC24E7C|nr:hypothetical protein [Acinetobacter sp.]RUP42154.1 MAG: hypothetical protein EKK63_02330 [Acinetobacter sp.]
MTALEMHIEVNQSLQKVAANSTKKFLTEEIDWVLNKMQDRFIQQCLRPVEIPGAKGRFQVVDQLKQDALKPITVTGHRITTYKVVGELLERVVADLPGDYEYLLGDMSHYRLMCGEAKSFENESTTYAVLNLSKTTKASAPFYVTGAITIGSYTINIPADLGVENQYAGFPLKENVTLLRDFLLHKLRAAGAKVYWENFADKHYDNSIICTQTPALTWDSSVVTSSTTFSHTVQKESPRETVTLNPVDNRLLSTYDVFTNLNTPFYKTSYKSPVAELAGQRLYIYEDETFTVRAVTITYIRKPRPISLVLGSNCELSSSFHQTICDLAVEYLKGRMENPQGESLIRQDLETRVII